MNSTCDEVRQALLGIKRKTKLDTHGVCVQSFNILFLAHPNEFCKWLDYILCTGRHLPELRVRGFVSGKASARPEPNDTRAVLPQPALAQILDRILEARIMSFIAEHQELHPACFIGAGPGTQPLDSVQLAVEKMCDLKSVGCVAQCDIARYYDNLDLLTVVRSMAAA